MKKWDQMTTQEKIRRDVAISTLAVVMAFLAGVINIAALLCWLILH